MSSSPQIPEVPDTSRPTGTWGAGDTRDSRDSRDTRDTRDAQRPRDLRGTRGGHEPGSGRWAWVREGAVAAAHGLGLTGLMLAGLGVLALLLIPVFCAGLGIGLLVNGPSHWHVPEATLVRVAPFAGLALSLLLIPPALLAGRGLAVLTRRLSGDWCGVPIRDPYQPPSASASRRDLLHWLADPATRRDTGWLVLSACGAWTMAAAPAFLVIIGLNWAFKDTLLQGSPIAGPAITGNSPLLLFLVGVGCVALGLWAAPRLLRGYGMAARSMLAPTGQAELAIRVHRLAETRSEVIDSGAAEMRRIERDLHDGAQARLVAMGMTLDAADRMLDDNPAGARALLAEARDSSARALAELRDLVRGIHPPVLADRGLAEAVRALALEAPVRVAFASELTGRPPAPVESAAYFAVSELLANVAKHAGARRAWVDLRHDDDAARAAGIGAAGAGGADGTAGGMLRVTVSDDGTGGADPARGTGLAGIERRLAAFDGVLAVSSPPGGPTVVNMEIPCALSSPKTSSC